MTYAGAPSPGDGGSVSSRTSRDVLVRGLRVLGLAIREQPRIFTVAVAGSVLFSTLIIANAYVIGAVIGQIVVPAFSRGSIDTGLLALGAAVLVGVSVLRV